jgi:hypothetical protein
MAKSNRVVAYVDDDTLQVIDIIASELGIHRSALIRGVLLAWARKQWKIREKWDKIVIDSNEGIQVI